MSATAVAIPSALSSFAARLTEPEDRETYAALISYFNSLPEHDEMFRLVELLGLLALVGQHIPDALAEMLVELRAQATASQRSITPRLTRAWLLCRMRLPPVLMSMRWPKAWRRVSGSSSPPLAWKLPRTCCGTLRRRSRRYPVRSQRHSSRPPRNTKTHPQRSPESWPGLPWHPTNSGDTTLNSWRRNIRILLGGYRRFDAGLAPGRHRCGNLHRKAPDNRRPSECSHASGAHSDSSSSISSDRGREEDPEIESNYLVEKKRLGRKIGALFYWGPVCDGRGSRPACCAFPLNCANAITLWVVKQGVL